MHKAVFGFLLSMLALQVSCRIDDDKLDSGRDTGTSFSDRDGDGYPDAEDCAPDDPDIHENATEICDGQDNDCDGEVDEGVTTTYYLDSDSDNFGDDSTTVDGCEKPEGYVLTGNDCDDDDPTSFPGATEICDEADNDCDGLVDEELTLTWYADTDGDGYGDPYNALESCDQPTGYLEDQQDCDDTDPEIFPEATEICDGLDNDCDKLVDEGVTTIFYEDADGDGFGNADAPIEACALTDGLSDNSLDCDDTNSIVNPDATEYCNNIDDDCDGIIDENDAADVLTWYRDSDLDGFGDPLSSVMSCDQPSGYVSNLDDCDDTDATTSPIATEYCNGKDDDCDGEVDEASAADSSTWYMDRDADSWGDESTTTIACDEPTGFVAIYGDCDDLDSSIHPGADEYCNGVDDDCDDTVDEPDAVDVLTWFQDSDDDGYGDLSYSTEACEQPSGYVADSTDCDDSDSSIHPGADEYCNGIDDDCDGVIDENSALDALTGYLDFDDDGYGDASSPTTACELPSGYVADSTDCDDSDSSIHPGADEYCNNIDDDCDGTIDNDAIDRSTWYADSDTDGFGDPDSGTEACEQPSGYIADSTDCDDDDPTSHPGGIEVCDGADNDCNGIVDDDPTDGETWYADSDSDGTGDATNSSLACEQPDGFVDNSWDCDDDDPTEPVVASAADGTSTSSGTLADPLDSIQAAVDAAESCVIALAGTYEEQVVLSGTELDVWGVDGSSATIIDPDMPVCDFASWELCGPAVTIASGFGASPQLHGFTITGGSGYGQHSTTSETCVDSTASASGEDTCTIEIYDFCGGGLYINGDDPELSDLLITDNVLPEYAQFADGDFSQVWVYSHGGGICAVDSYLSMDSVTMLGNFADQGGGLYVSGSGAPAMTHCILSDNSATDGGAILLDDSSMSLSNTIFSCNTASTDAGAIFLGSGSSVAQVQNSSFYGDQSDLGEAHGAAIYGAEGSTISITSSIIYTDIAAMAGYGVGSGTFDYDDIFNVAESSYTLGGTFSAGTGVLTSDPLFLAASCDGDPDNDDFHLAEGSPAIDAGDPDSAYNDADGSRNDMGAYGGPDGSW